MSRILVIDDDTELCELLADYLKPEGFQLTLVHDGEQGLQRAVCENRGIRPDRARYHAPRDERLRSSPDRLRARKRIRLFSC